MNSQEDDIGESISGGNAVLYDRRTLLASGLASMVPVGASAQQADRTMSMNMDGGQWCSIPNFAAVLAGSLRPETVVCGWRPERRVINKGACVRLEKIVTETGKTIIHNYGHGGAGITLGLGCASLAERTLAQSGSISRESRITIVGAGMIGLSTAYVLKRRGYTNISVKALAVASGQFGRATTVSDIAGGQFDAAGVSDVTGNVVNGSDSDARLRSMLKESIDVLTETRGMRRDPFLTEGSTDQYIYTVVRNYVVNPYAVPPALQQASDIVMDNAKLRAWIETHIGRDALAQPAASGVVAPFQELQRGSPETVRFGVRNIVLINTVNLLRNMKRFLVSSREGPSVVLRSGPEHTVRSFGELQSIDADVIFNCTGLGGAVTGGADPNASMLGRYGLLAKMPRIGASFGRGAPRYLYSGFGYMFPRSDGTIIGGAWDDSQSWALPQASVDQIVLQPTAAQAAYFSSVQVPGARDFGRAALMMRAMAFFFLGRNSELSSLAPSISWLSGSDKIGCAVNRTNCS